MSPMEVMIDGTLQADGTLELDAKPNLRPGRVTVVLREHTEALKLPDEPFWQRLRAIWAMPRLDGHIPDGGANSLAEVEKLREEWDQQQQTLEQLQVDSRLVNRSNEETEP